MIRRQYEWLRAELASLNELLATTPEEAVIDRMSLEYRKADVEAELAASQPPDRWPATARLTFNGAPVGQRQAILADFGGKAVQAFSNAVASSGAGQRGSLNRMGPIPNREDYNLLITESALGSFGFEIEEEMRQDKLTPDPSPVEMGIKQVKSVLEASMRDEESLSEAVADMHPRALADLRKFLDLMVSNRAVCSLSFQDDHFRFADTGEVRQSLTRLSQDNIQEAEVEIHGFFKGYLPNGRQAEFLNNETGELISARVDAAVHNADDINGILNQPVSLRARTRRVGTGRPRYTIIGYSNSSR